MTGKREHVCVVCKELPTRAEWIVANGVVFGETNAPDLKPVTPRPTDIDQHPRKPMCATHRRAARKATRAARRGAYVSRRYGLTPDEYEALKAFQGGTCAIPGCPATGKTRALAVDHDHKLAAQHDHPVDQACVDCVRGLLCYPHNFELIGKFKNSLQAGIDYLANPPMRRMRKDAA